MSQLKKVGFIGCEDLLLEINAIEHQLMKENSAVAMELMVLESKIRERFQLLQTGAQMGTEVSPFSNPENMSLEDIQALIPQDLSPSPDAHAIEMAERRKRMFQNIGWAAVFAVVTALGVFGLASLLQLALSWMA